MRISEAVKSSDLSIVKEKLESAREKQLDVIQEELKKMVLAFHPSGYHPRFTSDVG